MWYGEESFVSACPVLVSKEEAESNNSDTYTTCTSSSSSECRTSPCYKLITYKRNIEGCDIWNNWSEWKDDFEESSAIKESRSITMYKVK